MNIEYNKKYILGGIALFTIGVAMFGFLKGKKIPALPCSSIEEEINNKTE